MNFLLSISPSKEMGDQTRQRKKHSTLAGIELTTSGFDVNVKDTMDIVPLLMKQMCGVTEMKTLKKQAKRMSTFCVTVSFSYN